MNQAEEESLYHSLEEEAIDVDCLLVEPRSDQVSVSGVWCYEEDNLGKCVKTENASYNLGVRGSNRNTEGVDTTNLNALDVLPHEVGVENFLTTSNISPCDDYLLDFGFDHGACIGYVSNERLHAGNSHFPIKDTFELQNSLSENICHNYFLSSSEPKTLDRFDDFSRSFINQDISPPPFSHNGLDLDKTSFCKDGPTRTLSVQDEGGVGGITHKRSRKPTKRYIDESSLLSMKMSKKRREASSGCKGKVTGVRRVKSQSEVKVKPKDKMASFDVSFDKAIQVPFVSQAPTECQKSNSSAKSEKSKSSQAPLECQKSNLPAKSEKSKSSQAPTEYQKSNSLAKSEKSKSFQAPTECQKSNSLAKSEKSKSFQAPTKCQKSNSPPKIETRDEIYSSGSEDDDSETMMKSMTGGNQRKLHRLWTVSEVKKLIDGVAHFGVGKWTHIKKLLFSSSVHRTPVDLKDKWRNLLKASHALKGSRIEDDQKRSQPWRPLPKSILCRVRELASVYPYPRENNTSKISKSKVPLAPHVSSPARIKSNKVPVA